MRLVDSLVLKGASFNCLFGSPVLKSADILECMLNDRLVPQSASGGGNFSQLHVEWCCKVIC